MNSREQVLLKRIQRLERQQAALMLTFDKLLADLEHTESVGCAFAFDLALREEYIEQAWLVDEMERLWASALKEAGIE